MFVSRILLLFIICHCCYSQELVKVSVYYESLCPYSKDFIANQLHPAYEEIGDSLTVDLVPYGLGRLMSTSGMTNPTAEGLLGLTPIVKGYDALNILKENTVRIVRVEESIRFDTHNKISGKWDVWCHHGPKECYGNKLQACAIKQNSSQHSGMDFVSCMMKSKHPEKDSEAEQCAKESKIPWHSIKTCANSEEGNELLVHHGDITHNLKPKLDYVPHIIFNDKYNKELKLAGRHHFFKTVCGLFKNPPKECAHADD